jgi:hypothetical protein
MPEPVRLRQRETAGATHPEGLRHTRVRPTPDRLKPVHQHPSPVIGRGWCTGFSRSVPRERENDVASRCAGEFDSCSYG